MLPNKIVNDSRQAFSPTRRCLRPSLAPKRKELNEYPPEENGERESAPRCAIFGVSGSAQLIFRDDSRFVRPPRSSQNVGLKCSERGSLLLLCCQCVPLCTLEGIWGIPSLCFGGGGLVLNMEKEIEDLITGNRWKQAYEVSEWPSLPDLLAAILYVRIHILYPVTFYFHEESNAHAWP